MAILAHLQISGGFLPCIKWMKASNGGTWYVVNLRSWFWAWIYVGRPPVSQ